jgi:hypothetical protein
LDSWGVLAPEHSRHGDRVGPLPRQRITELEEVVHGSIEAYEKVRTAYENEKAENAQLEAERDKLRDDLVKATVEFERKALSLDSEVVQLEAHVKLLREALEPVKKLRDELRNQYIETYDTRHIDTMKYSAIVTKGMLDAAATALRETEPNP